MIRLKKNYKKCINDNFLYHAKMIHFPDKNAGFSWHNNITCDLTSNTHTSVIYDTSYRNQNG